MHHVVVEDLFVHVTGYEREERSAALVRVARWEADHWRDRNGNLRPVADVKALIDKAIAITKARHAEYAR